jgi:methylenetetrahydrofolate reductase (NADPH)
VRPRFELVPVRGVLEAAGHLLEGAQLAVSCSPTLGIERTLYVAEKLSERGFGVVPHVAARLLAGEGHLKRILRRMNESGLREVFVVGGDAREPAGPFAGGAELIRAMAELEHGVERVGIPAYPEGHPIVAEGDLMRALMAKGPFASYVVTQICFDPEAILRWLDRIRGLRVGLPV